MSAAAPRHAALPARDGSTDPWLWLEEVTGKTALSWVQERNARSEGELDADGQVTALTAELKTILDSPASIPFVVQRGEYLYNFWTDAEHPRGLWRRTTHDSYRSENPDWEVLIDVDALNAAEGEDWVWHGAVVLRPEEGQPWRRALIALSHGGSDSDVTREFDLVTGQFLPADQGGFVRPEAKGNLNWIDENTVFVATDFGPESTSEAGYPLQLRRWRRGTPMSQAELVYQGAPTDMLVGGARDHTPGFKRDWVSRMIDFYNDELFLLEESGDLTRLDVPNDCQAEPHRDHLLLSPRTDWSVDGLVVPAGALAVAPLAGFLPGYDGPTPRVTVLFTPGEGISCSEYYATANFIVLVGQEDVRHFLEVYYLTPDGWQTRRVYQQVQGSLGVSVVDHATSDQLWLTVTGFLQPSALYLADLAPILEGDDPAPLVEMKAEPSHFDTTGLEVTQHFAISADGTRVPYFQVSPIDQPAPEANPTLLYGYGGFEVSLPPSYSPLVGKAWLERGHTYVVANIRGGGEYGPSWHQAALQRHRHRAYEDFQAVAEDLISRGVTVRERLACRGGSNGGLLTGNMLVRSPGLFGAVVIQVPLLDMKRYTQLLAGASWVAEYGDPAGADWEFIKGFSPYHLLEETTDYPATLITTSTRDDRVHPGHARKMAAALEGIGANVRYWENVEGGHGGAADNAQAAKMNALIWSFLHQTIGG